MKFKIGDAIIDNDCKDYGTGIIVGMSDMLYRVDFENHDMTDVSRRFTDEALVLDRTWNSPLRLALG